MIKRQYSILGTSNDEVLDVMGCDVMMRANINDAFAAIPLFSLDLTRFSVNISDIYLLTYNAPARLKM